MRAWPTVMLVTLVLLSCNSNPQARSGRLGAGLDGARDELAKSYPAPPPSAAVGTVASEEKADAAAPSDQLPRANLAPDGVAPTLIIRTGTASIEVDTLEPAVAQLQQLTARLGGYIANSNMQIGREQLRQATLEIKMPANRFDELTAGLRPFGKVEYVNVNAEDVGEEYTDVSARVANARRLEERLLDLLAARTGKLQDVLAVERELARVRETIERYEGRLRYLKARTAVSTLSVTLHEPLPLSSDDPGANIIGDAFVRAWRNFVAVVAGFIASLGFLVPLAALLVLAIFLVRRYRKR